MREISYTLINPTGNITLLVESPVPAEEQPAVASRLMELEPETEQVGFVQFFAAEDAARHVDVVLRMAGGEFCGNATMSAAALYLERRADRLGPAAEAEPGQPGTPAAAEKAVTVRVSGMEKPVGVRLKALADGAWRGTVAMPQPEALERVRLEDGSVLPVVRFPGISHVIVEESTKKGTPSSGNRPAVSKAEAEALAPLLCASLGAEALGLMFLNREKGTLTPLVCVPDARTLVWESSCASGTTAVGAWMKAEQSAGGGCGSDAEPGVSLSLKQPGGTLEIAADAEGALYLTGTVSVLRRGMMLLN